MIDSVGLHPTQDKISAVKCAPAPTNVTQLKSFLGLIMFYSRFLKTILLFFRVGKMPAFMSKVHAGGIYRRLLVFTGIYWNLPAFTDIAGFSLLFLVLAQN